MKVLFTDDGWNDYLSWKDNRDVLTKIHELIENIRRTPFQGLGKPEPLKGDLAGFWARRITREHRLVYCVDGKGENQQLTIVQCRYHY